MSISSIFLCLEPQHRYKVLEEQRERDHLIRQLQEASHRRIYSSDREKNRGNSDNIPRNDPGQ